MLSVTDLSYSIGKLSILHSINLHIDNAQIVGLLGPSGSGKTTLLRHIVGVLPSGGKIVFNGNPVPFKGMYDQSGYMLQSDALYDDLSCRDNLIFFARIFNSKNPYQSADHVLDICRLYDYKNRIVKNLSGGMKRRLSLGVALINNPKFLILDEPTVGIDPVLRRKFWLFFKELRDSGVSIIISTHIMSDAEECDNLYVIQDGRIVADGSPLELKQKSGTNNMDDVYTLVSS